MKKKIAILGSTGSIGTTSLDIIGKNKNLFNIEFLSANKNYKKICSQIIKFKPRYFVINNKSIFLKVSNKFKKNKVKIINNLQKINLKKKIDITVAAIPGIAGLEPTIFLAKRTKKLLIANKESVICGWNIINKISRKHNTKIIPLDSEHFSLYKLTEGFNNSEIEKLYITASGGPFLNLPLNKFKNIRPKDALKHPKWKMGKKISIDSSTLMNKIFELIEAQKLFPFDKNKFQIIIHPQSLVHAIVKFKNGLIKFLYHEPDMTIPIANAIFEKNLIVGKLRKEKKFNLDNLKFLKVDKKRFPTIKIIPKLGKYASTPIILNASNEILVDEFLKRKISFKSIFQCLELVLRDKNYKKYAIQKPLDLKTIYNIDLWARNKTIDLLKKKKF